MGRAARRLRGWTRVVLAPRARLLPALGARLGAHPRLALGIVLTFRSLPSRRARALAYRHISGPFCERLGDAFEVPVVGGCHMIVNTYEPIGRTLAASGTWEPGVTALFQRLLAPGDVCVDAGANAGYFTLLASRLVAPTGRVYSLEPAPGPYRELLANLALNRVENVIALPVAAGAAEAAAELHAGPRGKASESSLRAPAGAWPTVQVAVRPIPTLLEAGELERLRLVKLDVEGFEVEVLRGLETVFEQGFRPALVAELHPLLDPQALGYLADLARRYDLAVHQLTDDHSAERDIPRGAALPFVPITTNELVSLVDSHPSFLLTSRSTAGRLLG